MENTSREERSSEEEEDLKENVMRESIDLGSFKQSHSLSNEQAHFYL